MKPVYLDNAATTWPDPQVVQAMARFRESYLGNASSIHRLGVRAAAELEVARATVAGAIHAVPEEIVFTASGTESNNLALKGYCLANRKRGNHLIVSSIEHPSVLEPARWLESRGFRLTSLPVDSEGIASPAELHRQLMSETILVSVMHANNEVGSLQDIAALAEVCAERRIAFHTDACQSFTKVPLQAEPGLTMATLSSHKIHGPSGVAALYVRAGTSLEPLLQGGGQEGSLRAGTYNVEGIVGFATAVSLANSLDVERMTVLRDRTIAAIHAAVPGAVLNGATGARRLCNNICFSFPSVHAKSILFELDRRGIVVSVGSACSSGKKVASHVLCAMGRHEDEAADALRFSLNKWTTQAELDSLVTALVSILGRRTLDAIARA